MPRSGACRICASRRRRSSQELRTAWPDGSLSTFQNTETFMGTWSRWADSSPAAGRYPETRCGGSKADLEGREAEGHWNEEGKDPGISRGAWKKSWEKSLISINCWPLRARDGDGGWASLQKWGHRPFWQPQAAIEAGRGCHHSKWFSKHKGRAGSVTEGGNSWGMCCMKQWYHW